MKVDADLRAALRAAEKGQQRNFETREQKRKERKAALDVFLKSSKPLAKKLKQAMADLRKAKAQVAAAEATMDKCGVSSYSMDIDNDEEFRRAGGDIAPVHEAWKAETVIAELLAAKPQRFKAVLAKYGINWD